MARPDRREVLQNASVLVSGPDIIAVGSSDDVRGLVAGDLHVDVVDCSDKIVMPGLVNSHNHSPLSVTNLAMTAAADDGAAAGEFDLLQFIEDDVLGPRAWFQDDSTYDMAMCGLMDQIRYGTTTTADAFNNPSSLYSAAVDSGIRSVIQPQIITNIMLDTLDEDGLIAQTEQCIRDYHVGGSDRVTVAVHPSWPWNCTESSLLKGMALAEKYNVQFATHLYELVDEKELADRLWADRGGGIAYLRDIGLINSRSVFFHGIELDDSEIDILAGAESALVHNPELNAHLWARVANVPKWLDTGMNVGLGTDYAQFDMFTAMKFAGLLPQMGRRVQPVDSWKLLEMATLGGAKTMWLDDKVGTLEPGKRADIITIDLSRNTGLMPICDDPNWIAALLTRQSTRLEVTDSMVNGTFLRRDGRFTLLDETEIVGRARHWCGKFVSDFRQMKRDRAPWHRKVHPMFERRT
jgi:cytosine/adenosine deaminase-related metal-dependent hydrolase